jgi:ribosomal protein S18 acetylase RimI-like enzyme
MRVRVNEVKFRKALREDVSVIVGMLADDPLGQTREAFEDPLPESYDRAFSAIESDTNQQLIVATCGGDVVGVMQLTLIPYLTYRGGTRALVEGVRVHKDFRGKSLGTSLLQEAVRRARAAGCHVVQLTTDKERPEALKFYEKLGFVASHVGMKLHL